MTGANVLIAEADKPVAQELKGIIESLGFYFLSGVWADGISYVVFLLVLMLKPEGLFSGFKRIA